MYEILPEFCLVGVSNWIEIDLVVRRGNRVGIVGAITGVKKAGIEQFDTADAPHYFGNHVIKFLVTGQYPPRAHKLLVVADEIHVIEFPGLPKIAVG